MNILPTPTRRKSLNPEILRPKSPGGGRGVTTMEANANPSRRPQRRLNARIHLSLGKLRRHANPVHDRLLIRRPMPDDAHPPHPQQHRTPLSQYHEPPHTPRTQTPSTKLTL